MSKLVVLLSLDWEGENLNRMKDLNYFRKQIGEDIPLTHFIVPSYFIQFQENARLAHTLVKELDEVALHLHPLRKLVEHFGVPFRREGNFYRSGKTDRWMRRFLPEQWHRLLGIEISGRGVPLTTYPEEELRILVAQSREVLRQAFPEKEIHGFRAGGNMVNDELLSLLHDLHFSYDASAFPPEIVSQGYAGKAAPGDRNDLQGDRNGRYTDYIIKLWGDGIRWIQNSTQPFYMDDLLEFPINGGMADFVTPTYLNDTAESLLDRAKEVGENQILSLGLHLEGDIRYEAMVAGFIQELKQKYSEAVLFSTPYQQIRYI